MCTERPTIAASIIAVEFSPTTVAEWYKKYGRHPIYAKNQDISLLDGERTIAEHPLAREERKNGRKPATMRRLPIVG